MSQQGSQVRRTDSGSCPSPLMTGRLHASFWVGYGMLCSPESKRHVLPSSGGISHSLYKPSLWRDLTPGLSLRAASPLLADCPELWEGRSCGGPHQAHAGLHGSVSRQLLDVDTTDSGQLSWPGQGQKWPEVLQNPSEHSINQVRS